jgi:hypothetical protein
MCWLAVTPVHRSAHIDRRATECSDAVVRAHMITYTIAQHQHTPTVSSDGSRSMPANSIATLTHTGAPSELQNCARHTSRVVLCVTGRRSQRTTMRCGIPSVGDKVEHLLTQSIDVKRLFACDHTHIHTHSRSHLFELSLSEHRLRQQRDSVQAQSTRHVACRIIALNSDLRTCVVSS